MKPVNRNKGFTLIELLVVIAIIGVLSAVVLVSLNSARSKSRNARRLSDIRQIMTAMEIYYNDNGAYPDAAANYNPTGPTAASVGAAGGTATWSTFLAQWPTAPTPADGSCDTTTAIAAIPATPPVTLTNQYTYIPLDNAGANDQTDPAFYRVYTCLGAPTGGYQDVNTDLRVSIMATPNGITAN